MKAGKFISLLNRNRQQYIKEKIKDMDITISDFPVILIINANNRIGTSEAARAYGICKSQVSHSVRRLEKLGYIVQERSAEGRNKVEIELSEKGRALAKKLKTITCDWESDISRNLSEEEKLQFRIIAEKMIGTLEGIDMERIFKPNTQK